MTGTDVSNGSFVTDARRSGQSGHVRYASKRHYFIGEAKRRYARLVSIAAAERPLFARAVTPCLIGGELISSTVSIKARGHLRGPATVRSPGAPEKAQPVVVHSLPNAPRKQSCRRRQNVAARRPR
jgi:hypothetical protein